MTTTETIHELRNNPYLLLHLLDRSNKLANNKIEKFRTIDGVNHIGDLLNNLSTAIENAHRYGVHWTDEDWFPPEYLTDAIAPLLSIFQESFMLPKVLQRLEQIIEQEAPEAKDARTLTQGIYQLLVLYKDVLTGSCEDTIKKSELPTDFATLTLDETITTEGTYRVSLFSLWYQPLLIQITTSKNEAIVKDKARQLTNTLRDPQQITIDDYTEIFGGIEELKRRNPALKTRKDLFSEAQMYSINIGEKNPERFYFNFSNLTRDMVPGFEQAFDKTRQYLEENKSYDLLRLLHFSYALFRMKADTLQDSQTKPEPALNP